MIKHFMISRHSCHRDLGNKIIYYFLKNYVHKYGVIIEA